MLFLSTFNLMSQIEWTQHRNYIEELEYIKCIDSNNCFCLGHLEGRFKRIVRTTNGGFTWSLVYEDPYDITAPIPYVVYCLAYPADKHIYISSDNAIIFRSKDDFLTFDTVRLKPLQYEGKNPDSEVIRSLSMADSSVGIAGSPKFIFITTDGWNTFEEINKSINNIIPQGYGAVYGNGYGNLVYAFDKDNFLVYVVFFKQVSQTEYLHNSGVAKTTDRGKTWHFFSIRDTKTPTQEKYGFNTFFFIDKLNGWAVGNRRFSSEPTGKSIIYKTTDGGFEWVLKYSDPDKVNTNLLDIAFRDNKNGIAVGKWASVLTTSDGGETWVNETKANHDTQNARVVQKITFVGNTPLLSTYSDGIWRGTYPVSVIDNQEQTQIAIYPNPASDYIEINLNNEASPIASGKVKIFDVLGIEVGQSSLILNDNQAGMPKLLRIDISHLTAGMYYIRIRDKVEKFMKM